MTILFL
jgi:hypothetical protein